MLSIYFFLWGYWICNSMRRKWLFFLLVLIHIEMMLCRRASCVPAGEEGRAWLWCDTQELGSGSTPASANSSRKNNTPALFLICEVQLWGEIWSWYLNTLTILNLFSKLSCAEWIIYQWTIWKGTYLNPLLSPRCASLARTNHTQHLEGNLNSRCAILKDAFAKIK